MADIDNLKGGTKRVVEESSLDNLRGGTKRVYIVGGGGSDIPSQTGHSGEFLTTDGSVLGWAKTEQVQREVLPQADENEVGNIYQFVGTTDANYTNGYFYKCVSDGQQPATYSWSQVSVQPAPSGLPDQTGQSGKFLTTDGTDASWSDKPLVNEGTGLSAIGIGGTATGVRAIDIGGAGAAASGAVVIGGAANISPTCNGSIAIGRRASVSAAHAIQLSAAESPAQTNSDANTFKVANANGNFEIMSADGTIPAARHAALPSADGTYVLKLVITNGTPTLQWVAE